MEVFELFFCLLVAVTAFLYSSVGHGGASGYLALMALFAFPPESMKATALFLNLVVAGIAFAGNYKKGNFTLSLFLPFALFSIPMAFIGARIHISNTMYMSVLGVFLLVVSLRFLFVRTNEQHISNLPKWYVLSVIGIVLGLLSGILGIGGGVILSPIIILFGWATIKQTSGVVSAFILVNSVSGLLGVYSKGIHVDQNIWYFVIFGIVGALLGTFLSINKFSSKTISYILSVVLLGAGLKLLL